jgi:hypothetical protein
MPASVFLRDDRDQVQRPALRLRKNDDTLGAAGGLSWIPLQGARHVNDDRARWSAAPITLARLIVRTNPEASVVSLGLDPYRARYAGISQYVVLLRNIERNACC